jgi:hypothetical protein
VKGVKGVKGVNVYPVIPIELSQSAVALLVCFASILSTLFGLVLCGRA